MRGKGTHLSKKRGVVRITPAYAGKSLSVSSRTLSPQGSPPPMRGKVTTVIMYGGNLRITPAYAGKSYHVLLLVDED